MFKKVFCVLSIVSLSAVQLFAASVIGTVKDSSGAAVANATVTLQSRATATTVTNDSGSYRFRNVAVGNYLIFASGRNVSTTPQVVMVTNADSTYTVNLVMGGGGGTVPSGRARISGTVTNEATNAVLSGAKVLLSEIGGDAVDSVLTDAQGRYTFDSLAGGGYNVRVSMTGFVAESQQTYLTGTTTRTLDFALTAIRSGSITGLVTADSAAGAPLSGVKVVLAVRRTGAKVDSATTNNQGKYSFANVPAATDYLLTASLTGYQTASVRNDDQSTRVDTVNIVLRKVATGTIVVRVMKSTDSTALANAQLALTLQGTTTPAATGSTSNTGWATFAGITTGTYNISASIAGYTSRTVSNLLGRDENDTVRIYLAAATAGTKTIRGAVTDSATSAGVKALVVIRIQSATGSALTLFDSTDAQGRYSIGGIPVTSVQGTLSASATSYKAFSRQVTIGQPGDADTTIVNVKLAKDVTPVVMGMKAQQGPSVSLTGSLLHVNGFTGSVQVSVCDLTGRTLHQSIVRGPSSIALPAASGTVYLVRVKGDGALVERSMVVR